MGIYPSLAVVVSGFCSGLILATGSMEDFVPVFPVSGGFPKQPLSKTALAETPAVKINLRRET